MGTKFLEAIRVSANRAMLKVNKYSPELFLGFGLIGMGAGIVLACKATIKANKKVEEFNEIKNGIEEKKQAAIEEEAKAKEEDREPVIIFDEAGSVQEISDARRNLMVDMLKLYGLPAAVIGLSTASILHSYGIIKGREMTYMALYTASQKAFKAYRGRVKEKHGEDADYEFLTGAKKTSGVVEGKDPEGNSVVTEKEAMVNKEDPMAKKVEYGLWFARGTTPLWQVNSIDNESFLLAQQAYWNNKLKAEGHVILADVYKSLGFAPTNESLITGWVKDSAIGDNYVSFGPLIPTYDECGDYVGSTGRIQKKLSGHAYYLDFNVDGCIYGLI